MQECNLIEADVKSVDTDNAFHKQVQETSLLRLMEVISIRDTLKFMNEQRPNTSVHIPSSIKTQGMEGYDYDEAALNRLEAKLLKKEEVLEE